MNEKKNLLVFIIPLLLIAGSIGIWYYTGKQRIVSPIPSGSSSQRVIVVSPQPTPTIEIIPTEVSSPSATPKVTVSPTKKPAASPTKTATSSGSAITPTKAAATSTPKPTTAATVTPTP